MLEGKKIVARLSSITDLPVEENLAYLCGAGEFLSFFRMSLIKRQWFYFSANSGKLGEKYHSSLFPNLSNNYVYIF